MKFIGGNNIAIDKDCGIFRVARRAFVSDDILQAERAEIFDKCWLYLGHDSELALPGAFVSRGVGGRDVIFNRDLNGRVHAFLDACPHRGARLCLERSGVAQTFHCIYHGWSFAADGTFRRHSHHTTYPAGFEDGGAVDLVAVPKLESYRGFWFVCFDRAAVPLADYLDGAREYLDCVADGRAALEAFDRNRPSAVILDLRMPYLDGLELTTLIRERDPSATIPILVLTASGGATEWRQLAAQGADRLLMKPVNLEDVVSLVRRLLNEKSRRSSLPPL